MKYNLLYSCFHSEGRITYVYFIWLLSFIPKSTFTGNIAVLWCPYPVLPQCPLMAMPMLAKTTYGGHDQQGTSARPTLSEGTYLHKSIDADKYNLGDEYRIRIIWHILFGSIWSWWDNICVKPEPIVVENLWHLHKDMFVETWICYQHYINMWYKMHLVGSC